MQNDSIDNLRLDLNKKSVRGVIYVRVGDTRARTVHITLTSNGKVVDLSDAAICEILIRKPDGSQNDQATINEQAMVQYGNELQYTFRTQDINVPGECHCQVMVTFKDGAVVTSPDFSVMVYEKEVSQEYEQSTNEYSAITQQLIDVMELRNQTAVDAERAETARENIEDIEASCEVAKGQVEELTNRAETAAQSAEASAQSAADDLQATQNYRNEALNYKEETDINRQAVNDKAEEILSYEYQAQQYALSAEASATSASASESSAQTSATSAEGDAISSRSYAKGGTGTRTGEDVDNSKYYYEQARDIAEGLQGALLPQGTITFAQLDNVTVIAGYEWNISDDFVSDSRFNDGGGVQYAAGTNVYVTADLKFDCLTGSAVTGVKGSAESTYRKGYVEIDKENIGLSNVDNTSDANKPISSAQQAALNGKIDDDIVAYVESDTTATKRYEIGDQFLLNGTLYTATEIIPVNDTIVVNINCVVSDEIVEQISDLSDDISGKVSKSGDTMSGNLTIDKADGTVSDVGTSQLIIGNSTPEGTAGNSRGVLRLYGKGANYVTLNTDPTGNRTITVPDAQGTLAMTSDLSDYLKKIQKRGDFVKSFGGSGTYQYYKVATLTITDAHINYPIVFEVSKRNIAISHNVTIIFASTDSTDPNISTLSTNEDNKWYIKKTATSTWELYVDTENVWSPVIIHRIYGYVIDNGVTVTINGTGVSSIPSDSVGAVYRGNVNFANSAGSATSATQATQDGSGNTITSTYVKKAGDTMRGDLFIDKQDGTTSALGHSRVVLGNSTSAGTAKNSRGVLRVYGQNGYYANFFDNNTDGITANRTLNIPNKDGTLAMTSDISSEKFKENIKPLSADEANKLLDVEVVTFDYKDGVCGEDERYNNRGVIAEQVEPIIPYVVEHSTEEDEEVLRVDYRKFIPYLIKVVQNQQTEIDNLKAEIERIKEEK